jgi:hypothetical protein
VAIFVPYNTCFYDSSDEWTVTTFISTFVDVMYGIDILINFVSAYEDVQTGLIVVDTKKIAIDYIQGWFFIDLVATLPTQLLESIFNGPELKLARLSRLPRLYRVIRILRMFKVLKVIKKSAFF